MHSLLKARIILALTGVIVVVSGTTAAILFARGYRPNLQSTSLQPTGILVAQSQPDGANIYLNGQLTSATNTTLNLKPGDYKVEIKKDGYIPWTKDLKIQAEVVTRAAPWIFPSVPSLKAITSTGATLPSVSPDSSKIAFIVPSKHQSVLYSLDLSEPALGLINRDPKKLVTLNNNLTSILWSPDSRQILAVASTSANLVDVSSTQSQDVTTQIQTIQNEWQKTQQSKDLQKFVSLPKTLQTILSSSVSDIVWSPNEKKILYTATASATLPEQLIRPLPGSSTQTQTRDLKIGGVYVYDTEEDRNFLIDSIVLPTPSPVTKSKLKVISPILKQLAQNNGWTWFPSSAHVYRVETNKVIIKEYDNQNPTTVYAGPMESGFTASYPSGKQMIIITNLNPDIFPLPNLYAISLR